MCHVLKMAGMRMVTERSVSRKPPWSVGACVGHVVTPCGTKKTLEKGGSCWPEVGASVMVKGSRWKTSMR